MKWGAQWSRHNLKTPTCSVHPWELFLVVSLLLSLLSLILEDTVGYRCPNCGRVVHIHLFSVFGPSVSFCVKYYLMHKENFLKTSEYHNNFKIKGYTFRGLFDTMMISKIIWAISIFGTLALQSWVLSHICRLQHVFLPVGWDLNGIRKCVLKCYVAHYGGYWFHSWVKLSMISPLNCPFLY